jgi:hypothetical protein
MPHRLIAIMLALLVLVSSTGYSITAHLCHGKAVSYSLFGQPVDCGAGEEDALEEHCEHTEIVDNPGTSCQTQECCTNESRFFKGLDTAVQLTAKQLTDSFAFIVPDPAGRLVSAPIIFATAVKPPLADYRPPERTRDLPVWLHVFRI